MNLYTRKDHVTVMAFEELEEIDPVEWVQENPDAIDTIVTALILTVILFYSMIMFIIVPIP